MEREYFSQADTNILGTIILSQIKWQGRTGGRLLPNTAAIDVVFENDIDRDDYFVDFLEEYYDSTIIDYDRNYTPAGTFIIYHCPNIPKVGCTNNLPKRQRQYPEGTAFEIIEILENVSEQEAGDREWFWADHYNYKRGRHYFHCSSTANKRKAKNMGSEAYKAVRKKQIETLGPEGLSAVSQKRADNIGKDGYKAIRQKQIETMGPEGLSNAATKRWAKIDSEARSAIISKGWETRRRNKLTENA